MGDSDYGVMATLRPDIGSHGTEAPSLKSGSRDEERAGKSKH